MLAAARLAAFALGLGTSAALAGPLYCRLDARPSLGCPAAPEATGAAAMGMDGVACTCPAGGGGGGGNAGSNPGHLRATGDEEAFAIDDRARALLGVAAIGGPLTGFLPRRLIGHPERAATPNEWLLLDARDGTLHERFATAGARANAEGSARQQEATQQTATQQAARQQAAERAAAEQRATAAVDPGTRGISPSVPPPVPPPVAAPVPAPGPVPPPRAASPPHRGLESAAASAPAWSQLVPARSFMRSANIPPADVGAYGVLALKAKPTNAASRERLGMVCRAFLASLPPRSDLPASVPVGRQMVTIWPIDDPRAVAGPAAGDCDALLGHYDLYGGLSAVQDALRQGKHLDGRGPFLIGWSPSSTRGVPDAVVLVIDMSEFDQQVSFDEAFLFWQRKVVDDPALWRSGFSMDRIRIAARDFIDQHATDILKALKLGGE